MSTKFQKGVIPLVVLGVVFLVASFVTITAVTSNPLKSFAFNSYARYSADALIRQRERAASKGQGSNCKGAGCLAGEILANQNNPANQTGAAKDIIDTYNKALTGDQTAINKLKDYNAALGAQVAAKCAAGGCTPAKAATPTPTPVSAAAAIQKGCELEGGTFVNGTCYARGQVPTSSPRPNINNADFAQVAVSSANGGQIAAVKQQCLSESPSGINCNNPTQLEQYSLSKIQGDQNLYQQSQQKFQANQLYIAQQSKTPTPVPTPKLVPVPLQTVPGIPSAPASTAVTTPVPTPQNFNPPPCTINDLFAHCNDSTIPGSNKYYNGITCGSAGGSVCGSGYCNSSGKCADNPGFAGGLAASEQAKINAKSPYDPPAFSITDPSTYNPSTMPGTNLYYNGVTCGNGGGKVCGSGYCNTGGLCADQPSLQQQLESGSLTGGKYNPPAFSLTNPSTWDRVTYPGTNLYYNGVICGTAGGGKCASGYCDVGGRCADKPALVPAATPYKAPATSTPTPKSIYDAPAFNILDPTTYNPSTIPGTDKYYNGIVCGPKGGSVCGSGYCNSSGKCADNPGLPTSTLTPKTPTPRSIYDAPAFNLLDPSTYNPSTIPGTSLYYNGIVCGSKGGAACGSGYCTAGATGKCANNPNSPVVTPSPKPKASPTQGPPAPKTPSPIPATTLNPNIGKATPVVVPTLGAPVPGLGGLSVPTPAKNLQVGLNSTGQLSVTSGQAPNPLGSALLEPGTHSVGLPNGIQSTVSTTLNVPVPNSTNLTNQVLVSTHDQNGQLVSQQLLLTPAQVSNLGNNTYTLTNADLSKGTQNTFVYVTDSNGNLKSQTQYVFKYDNNLQKFVQDPVGTLFANLQNALFVSLPASLGVKQPFSIQIPASK